MPSHYHSAMCFWFIWILALNRCTFCWLPFLAPLLLHPNWLSTHPIFHCVAQRQPSWIDVSFQSGYESLIFQQSLISASFYLSHFSTKHIPFLSNRIVIALLDGRVRPILLLGISFHLSFRSSIFKSLPNQTLWDFPISCNFNVKPNQFEGERMHSHLETVRRHTIWTATETGWFTANGCISKNRMKREKKTVRNTENKEKNGRFKIKNMCSSGIDCVIMKTIAHRQS